MRRLDLSTDIWVIFESGYYERSVVYTSPHPKKSGNDVHSPPQSWILKLLSSLFVQRTWCSAGFIFMLSYDCIDLQMVGFKNICTLKHGHSLWHTKQAHESITVEKNKTVTPFTFKKTVISLLQIFCCNKNIWRRKCTQRWTYYLSTFDIRYLQ